MKNLMHNIRRLHHCERGAEGLEKLLIIAAIVLPLLGLLLYFKDFITSWVGLEVEQMHNHAGGSKPTPDIFPKP